MAACIPLEKLGGIMKNKVGVYLLHLISKLKLQGMEREIKAIESWLAKKYK